SLPSRTKKTDDEHQAVAPKERRPFGCWANGWRTDNTCGLLRITLLIEPALRLKRRVMCGVCETGSSEGLGLKGRLRLESAARG
ncbi:hypothetical protein, partial [uncultured Brevundimonas sp.]|uniref:hypothetical protein n=1 Tax=uncultured Brevundimonas sp. TaxID=213418 RepID=UPI0025F1D6CD